MQPNCPPRQHYVYFLSADTKNGEEYYKDWPLVRQIYYTPHFRGSWYMTDAFYYTPEDDKIYILDYDVWHYVMPECHQYSGRGAIIPNGEGASAEDPRAPYTYAVVIDAGSNIYFSI